MQFEMKQSNYIVCPKCNNDKSFECFGDRVDYGIYSIRIRCSKCNWVSDELYEETGYYPDLSKQASYPMPRTIPARDAAGKQREVIWTQNNF